MVVELTDQSFDEEVLKSEIPVMVDFYAPWCAPCHMTAPVIDKLAGEYDGKFKFCKINVDDNPQMAGKYNVMSIPLMLFFKAGDIVDQAIGAVGSPALKSKVDGLL
ncbi:MAG: thioredoxin [Chloroflexota bacterium]|nr:thioredoxin [Chloroflexota bacterium]